MPFFVHNLVNNEKNINIPDYQQHGVYPICYRIIKHRPTPEINRRGEWGKLLVNGGMKIICFNVTNSPSFPLLQREG